MANRPLAKARWLATAESRAVLAALTADGSEARFVGGCVRDTLLDPHRDPHDLDLTTPEPPDRVMALLARQGIRVIPTGIEHGTVTARLAHHSFEITTLRRDVSTDGRRATVAFTADFREDAARRDFTINAMSCDGSGGLFDYFGGHEDLRAGRVRFVGEPRQRIREDYLRILRWFRFFARFGREPPDGAALAACTSEAEGIDRLSGERLHRELFATLLLPRAARTLELMDSSGVLARAVPAPVSLAAVAVWHSTGQAGDPLFGLAVMLREAGADMSAADRVSERLRLSRAEAARLRLLVGHPLPDLRSDPALHRRAADAAGVDVYRDLLAVSAVLQRQDPALLQKARHELALAPPPAFPVDGKDVLALGVPPGPVVGRVLGELRSWWRDRDFTPDRAACLRHLAGLVGPAPP
jgi:poly(A) polymerase